MYKKEFIKSLIFLVVVINFSTTGVKGADILFIARLDETSVLMQQGDDTLKAYLEGLGHTVTYFDDNENEADMEAAAAAADVVFISESVDSKNINNKITEIETPMVITECWAWYEMGLCTPTPGADDSIAVATTDIEIIAPGHPLAAGLTGTVTVLTDIAGDRGNARISTGIPGSAATVVAQATLSDGHTYACLYAYEKGAELAVTPIDGSPQIAADIRVCLGLDEQTYLLWNENAFYLLEAAINFALGIRIQPNAYSPDPANGQKEVSRDTALSWRKGIFAEKHNVYFGTSIEDVNQASVDDPRSVLVSKEQEGTTYDFASLLDYGRTYYWRVDEVNAPAESGVYKGDVWSFTVRNFLVVDDFEGYDATNNVLYNTWLDYLTNNTGMTVGHIDEPYVEKTTVHSGKQSMPLRYDNDGTVNEGTTLEKSGTLFYSEAERNWQTPQNWTVEDVNSLSLRFRGYPAYVGSFVEEPAGTYTIKSTGADIWGSDDQFHFAYKEVASGVCSIIAKVESLEAVHKDSKAGIMIRDSLEPGSSNTALLLTPDPEKGLRFQNRYNSNGPTQRPDSDMDPNAFAPYWLRLERTKGGLVRAYRSPDGEQWTQFGLKTSQMTMPIYVGLAVTSHDVTKVCEARFSNVSFPNNANLTAQPWSDRDIGIMSNEIEPMYAAVNGKVIYNEDPNAVLINQWTEWSIPLMKFTDLGVNLTGVNSLSIGFGNRGSTQAGGEGTIYIDDIRLYRPPRQ
ncbi:MAG: hypothetical protein ACETVZ_07070 [Phycisphaerae bacterium]